MITLRQASSTVINFLPSRLAIRRRQYPPLDFLISRPPPSRDSDRPRRAESRVASAPSLQRQLDRPDRRRDCRNRDSQLSDPICRRGRKEGRISARSKSRIEEIVCLAGPLSRTLTRLQASGICFAFARYRDLGYHPLPCPENGEESHRCISTRYFQRASGRSVFSESLWEMEGG